MTFQKLAKKAAKGNGNGGSKKNGTPVLEKPELAEATADWKRADRMAKDAKALKAKAEGKIIPVATSEISDLSKQDGKAYTSVKVNDEVLVTVKNSYSAIDTENEKELKSVVGSKFKEFFSTDTSVSLTPAFLNDQEAQAKVLKAIGEENFEKFFNVKMVLKPTEAYHKQRLTNAEVAEMHEKLVADGLVNPAKPSFRSA